MRYGNGGGNVKATKHYAVFWGMACALFVFWLLITWRLHWQHLLTGAVCSLAIAYFNRELLFQKDERPLFSFSAVFRGLVYLLKMLAALFKANWEVARIVLSRNPDVSPCFVKFKVT